MVISFDSFLELKMLQQVAEALKTNVLVRSTTQDSKQQFFIPDHKLNLRSIDPDDKTVRATINSRGHPSKPGFR